MFSSMRLYTCLLSIVSLASLTSDARADAIVVNRAMSADTIAEVFIEESEVRVALEIGIKSLPAFRNLLPDALYERIGNSPATFREREKKFFVEDWIISADGEALPGRLTQIEGRPRTPRDAITGEPSETPPPGPESEPEAVVAVQLAYPLTREPKTLSLTPPRPDGEGGLTANIGFRVHHLGLPVIDFRYLGRTEILELDWDDPWYSKFRNVNLKRTHGDPAQVSIYIESSQVRTEFIARPRDLQHWVNLGIEGKEVLTPEHQKQIKETASKFLGGHAVLTVDGEPVTPALDRVHFIRRGAGGTGIVMRSEDIPVDAAMLGMTFVHPIGALPDRATLTWGFFHDRLTSIPAVAVDEAGPFPSTISPDNLTLTWQNHLTNPSSPSTAEIIPAPSAGKLRLPAISAILALGAVLIPGHWLARKRCPPRGAVLIAAVCALLIFPLRSVAVFPVEKPFGPPVAPAPAEAEVITLSLLRNLYDAFDASDDAALDARLADCATSEALAELVPELSQTIQPPEHGGATAKINNVALLSAEITPLANRPGFMADCEWEVAGHLDAWGARHPHVTPYAAEFTIEAIDGAWKIAGKK